MRTRSYFYHGVRLCILGIFIFSCTKKTTELYRNTSYAANIAICGAGNFAEPSITSQMNIELAEVLQKMGNSRLIDPSVPSGYPKVQANDNRLPAGNQINNVLELHLEIVWSDFHMETPNRPGLRVAAFAEKGKSPTIPAPLIRVEEGTVINATIENNLPDSTITLFGFQTRPSDNQDSLFLLPGEVKSISFQAGKAGTYFYYATLGTGISFALGEEEQLGGAFIIDPVGGSKPDRVFVMNIFSTKANKEVHPYGWFETLTINGKSWPYTELLQFEVGDSVRWRIVNISQRLHPMHLHGFYYEVLSRGSMLQDEVFAKDKRPLVVTETVRWRRTYTMQWVPRRPGNWLFHCHLSFHVSNEIRLPGSAIFDNPDHEGHMSGLVLGINVLPGPTDLVARGEDRKLTLFVNEYPPDKGERYGFSFTPHEIPKNNQGNSPGPLLILQQYQNTNITVENQTSVSTAVHWHGLEIDSWADGVPEWSASEGRQSPVIGSGEKFTYKLSAVRTGSFIYHSHLDDVHQLTQGLYGPMIVLAENETYHPETDHFYILSWRNIDPQNMEEIELNGMVEQPEQQATIGESHRLRLMNIAPAGVIWISMEKDGQKIPIKSVAKDGADLPEVQQTMVDQSPKYGVGETADFIFTPKEPGIYQLTVGTNVVKGNFHQQWIVSDMVQ